MKLHIVPAKQGLVWVQQGIRTFWRQPLAFTGLFFLFIAWVSLLSMIPVLGSALALLILPAATLGLMNPVFLVGVVLALGGFWRLRRKPAATNAPMDETRSLALRYVLCFGLPVFLFYLAYTLRSRVQPNWVATTFAPLAVFAVLWWEDRHRAGSRTGLRLLRWGVGVGLPLVVLLHETNLILKLSGHSLPVAIEPGKGMLSVRLSDPVDPKAIRTDAFAFKVWSLKRSAGYGSDHHGEHALNIRGVRLEADRRTVILDIPDLAPTHCYELKMRLAVPGGAPVERVLHGTLNDLGGS